MRINKSVVVYTSYILSNFIFNISLVQHLQQLRSIGITCSRTAYEYLFLLQTLTLPFIIMPIDFIKADRITHANGYREILPEPTKPTVRRKGRLIGPTGWRCRAYQLTPRMELVEPGKAVAIDCKGVILDDEHGVEKKGLGRFSAVTENGDIILDTFVYYPEDVVHRPSPQRLKLGVKYNDIKPENGAQPIAQVLKWVQDILDKSGVVVGHAIQNEMHMLRGVSFEKLEIRDTHMYSEYRSHALGRSVEVALRILAGVFLNRVIQSNGHSSVVDARCTMEL